MLDELDNVFDDHPSLDASLEDFENNSNSNPHRSPTFGLPSQHSGFRSEESDGETTEDTPNGAPRWSPPGFRGHDYVQGSGWYRHQPYQRRVDHDRLVLKPTVGLSPSQSREQSPQYEDAHEAPAAATGKQPVDPGDVSVAANVPLPTDSGTPLKQRSPSPSPAAQPGPDTEALDFGPDNLSNCRLPCLAVLAVYDVLTSVLRYTVRCARRGSASRTICRVFPLFEIKT